MLYRMECITLAEALKAYTIGSANAYGRNDIGVLSKGALADIIVVDRNLFAIDPMQIKDAAVDLTVMNGCIVYER